MMAANTLKINKAWIATIGLLFLIWTLWALNSHYNTKADVSINVLHANAGDASPPVSSSIAQAPDVAPSTNSSQRPLILYAYAEGSSSITNFMFFINHGLHDAADFLFVLNGETDVEHLIPQKPNIKYLHRANDCYDLGAFAEVLQKDDLYKKYEKFILMNTSIRGPFLPYWSRECWSDMFLSRITDEVKLVGSTLSCKPVPHVQSMIWATDRIGLETLLFPTDEQYELTKNSLPPWGETKLQTEVPKFETVGAGINRCPHEYWDAVSVEVFATPLIKAAGYKVDVMMAAYHKQERYEDGCDSYTLPLDDGGYFGMNPHPFDTVFSKSNWRGVNMKVIDTLSEWADGRKYSSYDYCR